MLKHKKIYENRKADKLSFSYRIQDAAEPLWLRYFDEYDTFYISLPKEVAVNINACVDDIIGPGEHHQIKISEEYNNASLAVTAYDEVKERILATMKGGRCRVEDVIISIKPSKLKGKLSKVMTEIRVKAPSSTWMVGDDFFDDLGDDETIKVDVDADVPPMDMFADSQPPIEQLKEPEDVLF